MIGVSILGAMLMGKLNENLHKLFPGINVDLGQMQKMAATSTGGEVKIPPAFSHAIAEAMSFIFLGALGILVVAVVAVAMIPQIQLRGRGPGQNLEKAVEGAAPGGPVTKNSPPEPVASAD
jgi:hypothetical protein